MKTFRQLREELNKSHFRVGDKVRCLDSGEEGEIVKVDPSGVGKYYTMKHDDGSLMKHSPDEIELIE